MYVLIKVLPQSHHNKKAETTDQIVVFHPKATYQVSMGYVELGTFIPYHTILYYTILYYTILYYTIHTILYYAM